MNRAGVDALTYDYTNSGNQLQKVTDGTTGNTDVGDFRDGNTTGNDYEYYTDGSLKVDKNKGIQLIEYDPFLKKVNKVTFTNGKWITFRYSGNGALIQRENSDSEKWDYTNGLIYKGGVPYQMNTNEGRAVWNGSVWEYEYEYRDIWGNLRLTYKKQSGIATATQSADYDIFGYEFNKQTQAKTNFFKYQKQQRIEDFGLNIDFFKFRPSDPTIGRFWAIDLLSSKYPHNSPYAFQENKFGRGIELEGLEVAPFEQMHARQVIEQNKKSMTPAQAQQYEAHGNKVAMTFIGGSLSAGLIGAALPTEMVVGAATGSGISGGLTAIGGGSKTEVLNSMVSGGAAGLITGGGSAMATKLGGSESIKTALNALSGLVAGSTESISSQSLNNQKIETGNAVRSGGVSSIMGVISGKFGKLIESTINKVVSNVAVQQFSKNITDLAKEIATSKASNDVNDKIKQK